jgi:hypothetical protein
VPVIFGLGGGAVVSLKFSVMAVFAEGTTALSDYAWDGFASSLG